METSMIRILIASLVLGGCAAQPGGSSPYAGQEARDIKALSAEERDSLLSGKGMGLAKAAELNGYPGPAHVLALAGELGLTEAQRRDTQALFAAMESRAIAVGKELVEEERRLDRLFADRAATGDNVSASLGRIGELQARLRGVHLEAHLEQARILSAEQVAQYVRVRGYSAHAGHHP
jgi:Spy/CpxP family protein refolding chaperone